MTLKNQQFSTLLERGSFIIYLSLFNADGCVYTNKMKLLRLHEESDQK